MSTDASVLATVVVAIGIGFLISLVAHWRSKHWERTHLPHIAKEKGLNVSVGARPSAGEALAQALETAFFGRYFRYAAMSAPYQVAGFGPVFTAQRVSVSRTRGGMPEFCGHLLTMPDLAEPPDGFNGPWRRAADGLQVFIAAVPDGRVPGRGCWCGANWRHAFQSCKEFTGHWDFQLGQWTALAAGLRGAVLSAPARSHNNFTPENLTPRGGTIGGLLTPKPPTPQEKRILSDLAGARGLTVEQQVRNWSAGELRNTRFFDSDHRWSSHPVGWQFLFTSPDLMFSTQHVQLYYSPPSGGRGRSRPRIRHEGTLLTVHGIAAPAPAFQQFQWRQVKEGVQMYVPGTKEKDIRISTNTFTSPAKFTKVWADRMDRYVALAKRVGEPQCAR